LHENKQMISSSASDLRRIKTRAKKRKEREKSLSSTVVIFVFSSCFFLLYIHTLTYIYKYIFLFLTCAIPEIRASIIISNKNVIVRISRMTDMTYSSTFRSLLTESKHTTVKVFI